MNAPRRQAWTAAVMGTTVSIHVIAAGAVPPRAADAAASTIAALRELDALFSPFRSASQVSRLRRGELALADADPRLREVARPAPRSRPPPAAASAPPGAADSIPPAT